MEEAEEDRTLALLNFDVGEDSDSTVDSPPKKWIIKQILSNIYPALLGKVLRETGCAIASEDPDKAYYLDPVHSGFRPGYGTEVALIMLLNYF